MPATQQSVLRQTILVVAAGVLAVSVLAVSWLETRASDHLLEPFTQDELDNNWEADRQFPSDGVTSATAFGRDDVARIGIDSDETQPGLFQRTEGIKTVGAQDFGDRVQVDLYVDPDWADKAVRAGFWVVGDDGEGNRDELFGIIEFVNNEPCPEEDCSNQANIQDHEGWRFWTSPVGWTEVATPFTYGEWHTLEIELRTDEQMYLFYVEGELIGEGLGGVNFIRELFLNSYNYGLDEFPNLSSDSYAAHWHAGVEDDVPPAEPIVKDDCKTGGFAAFGFRNQGQCIRYVNTGQDSR